MRFYIQVIQFNKEKQAENRTAPKAFDNRNDAMKEFHTQLSKDMGNSTLGWSLVILFNDTGYPEKVEKYIAEAEEATE